MMRIERRALLKMAASALLMAELTACASPPAPASSEESLLPVMTVLARDLFPHKSVEDRKYQDIAQTFLTQNSDLANRIVTALGGEFQNQPASLRQDRITSQIMTPDFQAYRFAVLLGLYDDLAITNRFGYEGPSFEQFGYLERGFNDLNWLPEPPVATANDRGL